MCTFSKEKIIILFAVGLLCFDVDANSDLPCHSCIANPKTISLGSSPCNCSVNASRTENDNDDAGWKVFCRTNNSITFQRETITAWCLVSTSDGENLAFTNQSYVSVQNLKSNSSYNFEFTRADNDATERLQAETLPNKAFETSKVEGIKLLDWVPNKSTVSAKIQWQPGLWSSCDFDFIWQSEMEIHKKEVRGVSDSPEIVLDKMMYDRNYTLLVLSVFNGDEYAESLPAMFVISTPKCIEINTPEICPPDALENFTVKEILVREKSEEEPALYNVSISWKLPTYQPLSVFMDFKTEHNNKTFNIQKSVPGNETLVVLANVELGATFKIRAWAVTSGGPGPPVHVIGSSIESEEKSLDHIHPTQKLLLFLCAICLIFAAVVFVLCLRLSKKKPEKKEAPVILEDVTDISNNPMEMMNSQYEVPRDSVMLSGILGEGAFGVVRKGCLFLLNGNKMDVAVKMLKCKPSDEEKEQLLQELNILHTIGQHNHVVSLVACCTICRMEDMLIIVEYCACGDLLGYLQKAVFKKNDGKYENFKNRQNEGTVHNRLYDALTEKIALTIWDLTSFAQQVADGMSFLAANRIVHRDLAARNVLVTAERTLKISDFGLSRDIYLNDCYTKTSNGKVPLKWMAIESLLHQKYTTQSDVWSFGVLMWEIWTFGATPYEKVAPINLTDYLKLGNRLPCPENASHELYSVMLSCWQLEPNDRPQFHQLTTTLGSILKNY